MREMKDSGVEWIGKIPNSWASDKVKYHFSNTKRIVGTKVNEYQRLALTLKGVIKRSKDDNEGLQPSEFRGYQILKNGELVFKLIDLQNTATSRVGLSSYTGIVSPAYIVLNGKDSIVPSFAEKYFLSMWYRNIFNHLGDSGVRSNLNAQELLNVSIAYPNIMEQHKIADFLDQKCSEIDALTADIQTQIETLEEYKKSVITEAVTKGLDPNVEMKDSGVEWIGEIPKEWNIIKAKYIFSQRNERGNTKSLQLLSPTQKYGVIPQSMYEELTGMKAVKLNDKTDYSLLKTIHSGDFCISLRSFQGGFEYSDYEGVVSPAYQIFYPTVSIVNKYYKFIFKDQSFIEKMNSYTLSLRDGKNIAFDDFGNSYLPVPSLQEQQKIADFLDKKCSEIDLTISEKQQQLETLAEYKKSLIYEYVTGKKEVA